MIKPSFIPGPLTTIKTVKEAIMNDLGSRDFTFRKLVKSVREHLLYLTGVSKSEGYDSVIIQSSGSFGIESVLSSALSSEDHLLILINGAYGVRIKRIAELHNITYSIITGKEDQVPDPRAIRDFLRETPSISHIAMVHCETASGILNPLLDIGLLCKEFNKIFIVDAMSSFGAIPIHMKELHIDFLIATTNKCISGIPGFAFVVAKTFHLQRAKKLARTLTLDLHAQWKGPETYEQLRFTPSVQSLLAFNESLEVLYEEGGIEARASRYRKNCETLLMGMMRLGFKTFLNNGERSCIITTFLYPSHPNFDFLKFHRFLKNKGFVIYTGKLSKKDSFRIETIGRQNKDYFVELLVTIESVLWEMNCYPLEIAK